MAIRVSLCRVFMDQDPPQTERIILKHDLGLFNLLQNSEIDSKSNRMGLIAKKRWRMLEWMLLVLGWIKSCECLPLSCLRRFSILNHNCLQGSKIHSETMIALTQFKVNDFAEETFHYLRCIIDLFSLSRVGRGVYQEGDACHGALW